MFTSRAEYRLSLRADNADQRLTPMAMEIGCVSESRAQSFKRKMESLSTVKSVLTAQSFTPKQLLEAGIRVNQDGNRRDGVAVLAFPDVEFGDILTLLPQLADTPDDIQEQIMRDSLYANYISRQEKEVTALKRDEMHVIPDDFVYEIDGLSNELKQKLERTRPVNLAQAARINGMTPAALALILATLKKVSRAQAKSA